MCRDDAEVLMNSARVLRDSVEVLRDNTEVLKDLKNIPFQARADQSTTNLFAGMKEEWREVARVESSEVWNDLSRSEALELQFGAVLEDC